jgi:hypothetical protein
VPPDCGQVVSVESSEKPPLKPDSDVIVKDVVWLFFKEIVLEMVLPRAALPKAMLVGVNVNGLMPVPVSATAGGCTTVLFVLMVSEPAGTAPRPGGVSVTPIVQWLLAANDPGLGHVVDGSMAYPAGKEINLMVSAVVVETFVKVTVLIALGEPAATLPKPNDDGETVAGATPVPDSATAGGCTSALFVLMVSEPAGTGPTLVGVSVTPMAQ